MPERLCGAMVSDSGDTMRNQSSAMSYADKGPVRYRGTNH